MSKPGRCLRQIAGRVGLHCLRAFGTLSSGTSPRNPARRFLALGHLNSPACAEVERWARDEGANRLLERYTIPRRVPVKMGVLPLGKARDSSIRM